MRRCNFCSRNAEWEVSAKSDLWARPQVTHVGIKVFELCHEHWASISGIATNFVVKNLLRETLKQEIV